jgi:glucuronate isomerase
MPRSSLSPDRCFSPDPATRRIARELYEGIAGLPLVCPHGHVDPRLFSDPDCSFGSPADLLIIPDHYVTRMLHSQGIPLESLGVPPLHPPISEFRDGGNEGGGGPVEADHRRIWQLFAESFHLFRGTPSGYWLRQELESVFGVSERLDGESAQRIYDQVADCLTRPEFRPRALFERFQIEVLCTTDAAADDLSHHRAIRQSGWPGRILPTFRPDRVVNLEAPGWKKAVDALGAAAGIEVGSYASFVSALESRRAFFKEMGAVATDHAALTAFTEQLSPAQAGAIFGRALRGEATRQDALRFAGHMLIEFARMSADDGLVMQLHVGAFRNHNRAVFERFGPDMGADIPLRSEFTRELRPLLDRHGDDPRLTLILFTLDETTYARELAPLAGHYPAVKLGPPWWFHDSPNGMRRYFDQVIETAGLYNTAGFNDDTRAFASIPARHDLWRRISADWTAGLVVRDLVDVDDARQMMVDLAVGLAKRAYNL